MPVPLIVIGAILLFFALLLCLRVRFIITLRESVSLTLCVLFLRIRLFPKKKKKLKWRNYSPRRAQKTAARRARKEARRAAKKAKKKQEKHLLAEKEPHKAATLTEKLVLVRALAATLFRKTGRHLKLTAARLHIRVATGDAASTAILYGAVSGVLASLLALLDRITALRAAPPQVSVTADYLAEKPSADVRLVLSMRVWGALATLFSVAISYLRTKSAQKAAKKHHLENKQR